MTIFLYGPDSYRRNKRLNNIIEEYRHKYSNLSCDCFDLENSDEFLRLKEFAAQMLIFDNKKLAVLRNIYEADVSKIKEFLKKYLKSEDFTILISEEKSPPTGLKFLLKESFSIEKFENFKGESWRIFIQKQAGERKLTLAPKAVYFLAESFKEDTWGLINELNKLSLLSQNTPINVEDLEKIGDFPYQSPNIFTFINALTSNYSLSQKVIALEKLFIAQEEPIKIFNILASLKRLSGTLLQKLADYDVMVKSGKMDYEEVLIDLALR
jgi:DNA polymerase III delta subunit